MEIDHYGVLFGRKEFQKQQWVDTRGLAIFITEKVAFVEAKQVETYPHPTHPLTTLNIYALLSKYSSR